MIQLVVQIDAVINSGLVINFEDEGIVSTGLQKRITHLGIPGYHVLVIPCGQVSIRIVPDRLMVHN